ncbi:hypothetical protein OIU74_029433 [Salix koriyanagi]|uniref:Uncharacterized protein n=1 Tax=Salix koriyanagi TaxID=2511006 RepID=A0A9Q0VG65_9ROSI|nr:hypothetical protein OIU74_029433 [Salix koriyanagi]
MVNPQGPNRLPLPGTEGTNANARYIEGPKAAPSGSWDNDWENDAGKRGDSISYGVNLLFFPDRKDISSVILS